MRTVVGLVEVVVDGVVDKIVDGVDVRSVGGVCVVVSSGFVEVPVDSDVGTAVTISDVVV